MTEFPESLVDAVLSENYSDDVSSNPGIRDDVTMDVVTVLRVLANVANPNPINYFHLTSWANELEGQGRAPWTEEEVKNLNDYQKSGVMHSFTCGVKSSHDPGYLRATQDGWVCGECDYTQAWAHGFMIDGSWRRYSVWGEEKP